MQKAESRKLLIGNIHVLHNPTRGEVKLGQIHLLISRAKILSERWGNAPVVLCGDFNSTPQLKIMLFDRRELSGQRDCHPAQILGAKQEVSSPLVGRRVLSRCRNMENKLKDDFEVLRWSCAH
ncbi:carbon catabolite repressor protein 4 homolog 3-like [Malus sylvestris]|uniref:carbon catabolite repressor protein 4 homolog 3-like n=1 Tax=Malus sylvestris TaxID=3752 RepID=UPI0021ABF83D|nr:carbon catabolite repressor protein 4 homolog 3-like [Malus sylvestris]